MSKPLFTYDETAPFDHFDLPGRMASFIRDQIPQGRGMRWIVLDMLNEFGPELLYELRDRDLQTAVEERETLLAPEDED